MEKRYTVKEVAQKIDRSEYTIGRWQKEGLFTPRRDDRGRRYFLQEDIDRLEEIKKVKTNVMLSGNGGIHLVTSDKNED
ncbi:helix-turn-helix domain-containing protein [Bacillus cereus group sp. MYBK12-2]|uniref:helix-turn-helix domain-containing protein n=1 Tax=Bacillus cereus group sp. MYBK12-2 TaxID=3450689 RepID=UPI003300BBAF|nr:MerR family transcriptional regulator [Bacillus pacificus]HDR7653598.1 MerR family transcriptional regulator [Bacillus pacificus]